MAMRTRVSTGTPLEIKFHYSRAVRVGDLVFVSGTTAMKDGALVGVGDAGAQTRQILANIVWALGQAGTSAKDVVRYRVYVTNIADSPAVVDEVSKAFAAAIPTATLVEVKGLINPDMSRSKSMRSLERRTDRQLSGQVHGRDTELVGRDARWRTGRTG